MSRFLAYAWLLAVLPLAACNNATSPSAPTGRNVSGRWNYAAAASDGASVLNGTLDVTRQDGTTISGLLDARELDRYGIARTIQGIMGGRVVSDASVEFDVVLAAGRTRRHLGAFAGDSVRGTWIETSAVQVTGTGTFRGARSNP